MSAPKFPVGSYVRCAEASKKYYQDKPANIPFIIGTHYNGGEGCAAYPLLADGTQGYGFWEKHLELCEGPW